MSGWARPEWVIMLKACKEDDRTLLDEAISMTGKEDLKAFYNDVSLEATQNSAIAILNNLIERSADVTPRWPSDVRGASKETLGLLLAHGWAGVLMREEIRHIIENRLCGRLLETTTSPSGAWSTARASIQGVKSNSATASLLAVETATYGHSEEVTDFINHDERMAMLHHLLDVVGLDVNAPEIGRAHV